MTEMNMTTIFASVFNMSLTASYCIAAVILLRFLLKKQPKILSYLLWSVVLFRLLCPVSLSSSFSLLRMDSNVISQADITAQYMTDNVFGADAHDDSVVVNTNSQNKDVEVLPVAETDRDAVFRAQVLSVGAWIWSVGVVLLTGYGIWMLYRLKVFLKKAIHVKDNVYEMEGTASPFVFGIIHPCIYLPKGLPEEERRYVLEHERVHIARKDYLIKILAWMARCIHWF